VARPLPRQSGGARRGAARPHRRDGRGSRTGAPRAHPLGKIPRSAAADAGGGSRGCLHGRRRLAVPHRARWRNDPGWRRGKRVSEHWNARPEGGGRFAIWLIRAIGLHGGRRLARLLLYPITLYFFLRRGYERRVSRAFLARVTGRPANAWQVMRHIHRFAGTILDRVYLLAERYARFDVRIHGLEELTSRMR